MGLIVLVRVGVIGTDNFHAYSFSAFMNGWDEREPIPARVPDGRLALSMYSWGALLRGLEDDASADVPVSGARVTALWSADEREGELLGRACGIERVCAKPEEACEDVDAVMVLSESPETHLPYARFALERGLPTYVDKPLAPDLETGREIFTLADRYGGRCFTGSAVRWSRQLLTVRDYVAARWGDIRAVHVSCPSRLELYGIHAVEMINLFLGSDVESVHTVAGKDREVVLLSYRDGRSAVFENLSFLRYPHLAVTLYGDTWEHRVTLDDGQECLLALVRKFVEFAQGGDLPVHPNESLKLIEIVTAAKQSHQTGHKTTLTATTF